MEHLCINDFKCNALYRLDENTRMLEKSITQISEEELWQKPNESLNSIGNLVLHLCGNMTQYVISSLGNIPDTRNRALEFALENRFSSIVLLQKLYSTLDKVKSVIENTTAQELLRERKVQGFKLSGIGIILHVVEHYSYHTGQIAFWVKFLKNKDLKFYEGMDLNTKNDE